MISEKINQDILLPAITPFVQLVLEGRTPVTVRPFFFGANLTALSKEQGGISPNSRELHAAPPSGKSCRKQDYKGALEELALRQLGFGVKGGAEAAVHAVRFYLQDPDPDKAVLKLDFRKAFNMIHRDWMLNAIREHAPTFHPFVHSAYSSPSSLFWMDRTIQSAEGVQQSDPLGPLLSCQSIQHMVTQLEWSCPCFTWMMALWGGTWTTSNLI